MDYCSNVKINKEFEILKSFVYNLVLAVFITILLGVVGIFAFNLRMDIVETGSMTPAIMIDDVVVIRKMDEYKTGDIIEFKYNEVSKPVTHRITNITTDANGVKLYTTKGDAGYSTDLAEITIDKINGKVIYIWEGGGKVYNFVKSNYFLFIDILVGLWVLSSVLRGEIEMSSHNIAKV